MLLNSQECVARAEECRRRAEATDDIPLREQFLSLHRGFLRHARQLEAREQICPAGMQQETSPAFMVQGRRFPALGECSNCPLIDIIDDDDAVRDSMHALLDAHGYDVRQHPSAEAFLSLSGDKGACLLVDYHMTGMTGLELLEHLHANGDRTPALVFTGRGDPTIKLRVVGIGAKLVHKPVEEDQLIQFIEQAWRNRC
jgi:two-component system response regulator FixJ